MIASESGGDLAWATSVAVEPYSRYSLSGWVRTESVQAMKGRGAVIMSRGAELAWGPAIVGTNDWRQVQLEFETRATDRVSIRCRLGGRARSSGRVWFDDLKLERVATSDFRPRIVIDVTQTRKPISKYIYGQFIEHLGRCIYGGIWAEMLEDRKFFHAVGEPDSPWRVIGDSGVVKMTQQNAFVGEHTPHVRLSGESAYKGIRQSGLALRRDKEYEGHIVLAGDPGAAPIEVSLIWGRGSEDRQTVTVDTLGPSYASTPVRFTSGDNTDEGCLEIAGRGTGEFCIGTVSLMPVDNVHGMRADVLKLLKELAAPIYRWPGGNFVSGYDWRDGIGDRDRRPPRKNPAWPGIEPNDFGIDEFIQFCREVGADPYVTVNSGLGDARLAAQEVEYTNSGAQTPMGKRRAANGHHEPYNVKWWAVGNEMYGAWQLGHMPLGDYIRKHNALADAMRAVDPSIELVAVGRAGRWSEQMLSHCADHMDVISEHFYCGEGGSLADHVSRIALRVRTIADAHRGYRQRIGTLRDSSIPIAIDEWNYWYGPGIYGHLGTQYYLKDALGVAAGLHEFIRNSDLVFMANYAQTVNVLGCIKTTRTDAAFAATGLVLKLYRRHFGVVLVDVIGDTYPLDVAAAQSDDGASLTIAVVNPRLAPVELTFDIRGGELNRAARVWRITGPSETAYNEPGKDPNLRIEEESLDGMGKSLSLPPVSVSLYVLNMR
jgi:alpha-N-arabinofuranosidase